MCDSENRNYFLVMKHQIEFLSKLMNKTFTLVVDGMDGVTLQGSTYSHPLFHTYVVCNDRNRSKSDNDNHHHHFVAQF